MRSPRIAILLLFFSASLFLFCRSLATIRHSSSVVNPLYPPKSSFLTFFSFGTPFTLFPSNAAISLTDDNSTFFPARPAAFGPALPADGLSGQLWVGSGFADDSLQEGGGEGELGCSDVPGWEDGKSELVKTTQKSVKGEKSSKAAGTSKNSRRDDTSKGPAAGRKTTPAAQITSEEPHVDDGTDDYLHQDLQRSKGPYSESSSSGSNHADIQSIQETAEITGKVVLLSRGGCGFLEKVKWAQRRGAVALIVGDNQKGGPLVQMFARGNVDNVTIPSVFTSRTTSHILSSLTQPGSFIEDILDDRGNPVLKVHQSGKPKKNKKPTETAVPSSPTGKAAAKPSFPKMQTPKDETVPEKSRTMRRSWFWRLFQWGGGGTTDSDRSRPPSSGRLDWVLVDEWNDEKDKMIKTGLSKGSKTTNGAAAGGAGKHSGNDDFQIGVEDWRDPDLVNKKGPSNDGGKATDGDTPGPGASVKQNGKGSTKGSTSGSSPDGDGPKGGSITPGSGEYDPEVVMNPKTTGSGKGDGSSGSSGGLMSKIFGDDDGVDFAPDEAAAAVPHVPQPTPHLGGNGNGPNEREGLWITITPTSSASPFFDTLLILVVSPLVTLTVVYALLILRAKIRRRRWRAPKSLVDSLPVRTYHTIPPSPSASSRNPSPTSSSPTTPLLQGPSRSRPRSRTTTGVPESTDLLRVDGALQNSGSAPRGEHEPHVSSEWKKYMGRQVECVVCLEEYVDGVSRVMSLPCGHEFHVECITPWLTTRRRTCPICKGDIVRSLARGSPSNPRYEPYHDDNGEASGLGPSRTRLADIEQGILSPMPRRQLPNLGGSLRWTNLFPNTEFTGPLTFSAIHQHVFAQLREVDERTRS